MSEEVQKERLSMRQDKGIELLRQGRTVDEMAEYMRKEGGVLTPQVMRRAVLGGLEVTKNKYGSADNIVVMGCFCFGVLLTVRSFCLLLNRLGVDYAFMAKEYCCGAPILTEMRTTGENPERGEELVKEFLGMNISQAREQGAKNIAYFCIWCAMLAKRFFSGQDINQLFFADLLVDQLKNTKLHLDRKIGYYRGCLRGVSTFWPEEDGAGQGLNWSAYRDLVGKIEGLEIVDIPIRYCCKLAPDAIFQMARKEGLNTIVCACNDCYGRLERTSPPEIEILFLSDILLDAMGGHSR